MGQSGTQSWKATVKLLQMDSCIICGMPVAANGSWDHFIPLSQSLGPLKSMRLGLAYWAHQLCNSFRGSAAPNKRMITRALDVIRRMEPADRDTAWYNLTMALTEHRKYVQTLETMLARRDVQ